MGPFAFLPRMECFHGLLSLDHSLEGQILWGNESLDFSGGRGYWEKDWGRRWFPGFIAALRRQGRIHTWATYRGSRLAEARPTGPAESPEGFTARLRGRRYTLEVEGRFPPSSGGTQHRGASLKAPVEGSMNREIQETLRGYLIYALSDRRGRILAEGESSAAGMEMTGELDVLYC